MPSAGPRLTKIKCARPQEVNEIAEYYLDIETNAGDRPNPQDPILTIQYQRLRRDTSEPADDLVILKSWQSSEASILEEFYSVFRPHEKCDPSDPMKKWNFVPVGYNLNFDLYTLGMRWSAIGKQVRSRYLFYDCPCIDIQPILIMMNKGNFKGSALADFTKKQEGNKVGSWYAGKDYGAIEAYIREEAQEFIRLYTWLKRTLPDLKERWFAGCTDDAQAGATSHQDQK